jgi:hypothetical protein
MEDWVKYILKIEKKDCASSEIHSCKERDTPDIGVMKEYEWLRFYKDP